MNRPASFRAVKFLPLFAAAALLTGCETHYTKFTVTDAEGVRKATWISEGFYYLNDQGYKIRAVERTSGEPVPVTNHYPNGWKTIVVGPNIVHERVDKPEWLRELDAGHEPTTATHEAHETHVTRRDWK